MQVVVDRFSGRSRGFGFVTFDEKSAMEDAIEEMNGMSLDGRSITVDRAQPQGAERDRDGGRGFDRDRDRDRGGRGFGGGRGSSGGDCFKCGKPGHFARNAHLVMVEGETGMVEGMTGMAVVVVAVTVMALTVVEIGMVDAAEMVVVVEDQGVIAITVIVRVPMNAQVEVAIAPRCNGFWSFRQYFSFSISWFFVLLVVFLGIARC
ncbi:hypothetical protein HPP92_005748 [Vanilla planifolia]|uniref:Uncharacterized protein n=1 Tax=Vanilla planifolia TaxID=51239 RepID=A0A835RHE3_VANPL|nr:hypothetical protein HPP92_005748 [Vanilla planifolia]